MSLTRIYQHNTFSLNQATELDEAASHHLARVLRCNMGDDIILFNGDGHEYAASITGMQKKSVQVTVKAITACNREAPIDIYLAQGIARGEKMDFITQKAVELGVKKIFPLVTERCNVRLNQEREEKRLQHWQSVVISACEQSGRNRIPELHAPKTLPTFLAQTTADLKLVLSPHSTQPLTTKALPASASILLLIGPEGGLSSAEIALAERNHYQSMQLGPRILRTETATIAALATILTRFGDF